MDLTRYITVFNNLPKNFFYLKSDFIGVTFNSSGLITFVWNIIIAAFLMVVYYKIGKKIRLIFFKDECKKYGIFIAVILGYIFVNSGLAILGIFSLLHSEILWIYIVVIFLISIYPYPTFRNSISELRSVINEIKTKFKESKWVFLGVLLFVSIAFLRLIPPEIGEDAIGYHTGDPRLFLKSRTTLISAKAPPYVIPAPHLGEMSYMLSEFAGFRDSARYIHFSFYFLVAFLLILVNPYAALFFVTAPVVIQISSKANLDFQWILSWLLSIFLLTQSKLERIRSVILAGILFGGVLASKLWTIAFFPLFILYLLIRYRKLHLLSLLKIIFIFSLSVFLIDAFWLYRSYIIIGDPVYPGGGSLGLSNVIGFNKLMFQMQNISVFSPLFYLGIAGFIYHWRYGLKFLRKANLSLFFSFLAAEYLFIQYHFGRYLLGLYSLAVLITPVSVTYTIKKCQLYKAFFIGVFGIMFIYYFLNTLLVLPYGFGWADNNKYLTRILARDNASYYDFDRLFDRWISSQDRVATYGISGYYYANFDYIDVNYIFDKNNKSFDLLVQKNVTKMFIKGGNILWFCKTLNLSKCNSSRVKLLASYPKETGKYNLYSIKSY